MWSLFRKRNKVSGVYSSTGTMFGVLSARRAIMCRPIPVVIEPSTRSFQLYKVIKVQYQQDKLKWRQYTRPPILSVKETDLHKHLEWHATDEERLKEMERYRISSRHVAAIMGEDPKTFTYDDQEKAMRYLMPGNAWWSGWTSLCNFKFKGYVMYNEANPKLVHPQEWMGAYKNPESLARRQNVRLNDGRPDHYLYFNEDITILDALTKLEDFYNILSKERDRIEEDVLTGKIKEYPEQYR